MPGTMARLLALMMLATAVAAQEPAPDEFTERITAELRATDPAAADLFEQANDARDVGDLVGAEKLYRRVLEREPSFFHAERRLASVVLGQGRRDEALALLHEVLATAETPENRAMLVRALTTTETMTDAERDEALAHARVLVQNPELDPLLISAACEAAVKGDDPEILAAGVAILRERAPQTVAAHLYAWPLAMRAGDLEAARRELEQAHALGLPDGDYVTMLAATLPPPPPPEPPFLETRRGRTAWTGLVLGLVGVAGFLGWRIRKERAA